MSYINWCFELGKSDYERVKKFFNPLYQMDVVLVEKAQIIHEMFLNTHLFLCKLQKEISENWRILNLTTISLQLCMDWTGWRT